MAPSTKRIFVDALSLDEADREKLLDALADSFPPVQLNRSWQASIALRTSKMKSGQATSHGADGHLQALQEKYA